MTQPNLSSLLSILNRRKWLAITTFVAVMAGAIAYLVIVPPQYRVRTKLMLKAQQTGISELGRDLQLSAYQTAQSNPLATQAELATSKRVKQKAVKKVFPQGIDAVDSSFSMGHLNKNLQIKIIPSTNILELSYQHQKPQTASKIINAITETLVAENIQTIRSQAQAVRKFLEQEIAKQREITQAATLAENNYRQKYGLVAVTEQTTGLVNSLETLESKQRELQSQLDNNQRKSQEFQRLIGSQDTENAYVEGRVKQDNTLQTLHNKLIDLEIQLANARSNFTDSHPTVLALLEEQDELMRLYQEALARISPDSTETNPRQITSDELSQNLITQYILNQIEASALQEQLQTLENQRKQLQNRLGQIPRQQQPLAKLVREKEEAVNSLNFLESKLGEARLAEAQLLSNLTILELSEASLSNKTPSKKVVLVFAGFVGLMFATGMILLQETLDNTLYQDLDVERWLNLPVLGELPSLTELDLNLNNAEFFLSDKALVEPYRKLLKTLQRRELERLQSIVISSAISGEGKSLVAVYLGTVAAMLSYRTLIIDANLYNPKQHEYFGLNPKQHEYFGLNSSPGLTDIIDHEFSLEYLIQPTHVKNLSILSCGKFTSYPYSILESGAVKSFLREAKKHYDLIIIDTAPLGDYSDAITLSEFCEGFILVARYNFTDKRYLKKYVRELQRRDVSITGIALNCANMT